MAGPSPATVCRLIDGRPDGILVLVDKAGATPKPSDRAILERLHAAHAKTPGAAAAAGRPEAYRRPALARAAFTVVHGCGPIDYSVGGGETRGGGGAGSGGGFLQSNRLWLGSPAFGRLLAASAESSGACHHLSLRLRCASFGRKDWLGKRPCRAVSQG